MTVACGGRCGRSDCKRTFKDDFALNGHVGGVLRARAKGAGGKVPAGNVPSPPGPEPSRPFYADLKELPWTKKEEGKPGSAPTPGQVSQAPPGPLFDSSPWWFNLGKLLDETLLADKKVKINMSEASAKRLDASLQAAGWRVEANPNPISLPYWLPFAITAVGAFAFPLIVAYVPDLIKKARDRAAKAKAEADAKALAAAGIPVIHGIRPQAPAPPTEGEEEEAEPIRIEAGPPPFQWRAMPWHEPGSE